MIDGRPMTSRPLPQQLAQVSTLPGCDYCDEFAGRTCVFSKIYADVLQDRLVAHSDSFVAFPTLGQIVPGYLLVAPIAHVENLARLPRLATEELDVFMRRLLANVGARECVIFEHGSTQATGGGCGIYHAHLHVIPHRHFLLREMLPGATSHFASLPEALLSVAQLAEYLLFGSNGQYATLDITGRKDEFPSQYFRRRVAAALGCDMSWDWRQAVLPERALVDTVEAFRG